MGLTTQSMKIEQWLKVAYKATVFRRASFYYIIFSGLTDQGPKI
jgi:hypothetical protein